MSRIERASAKLVEFKLDQAVGGSGVAAVDVIIVQLEDAEGAKGLGFSYVLGGGGGLSFAATEAQLARFIRGKTPAPPRATWQNIVRGFNRTGFGPNLVGLAAIDVAMWDIRARRQGIPLGVAMGGESRLIPVYGSGGFNTQQSSDEAADVAAAHVLRGMRAVKPRVGGVPKDAQVLSAVKRAVGDGIALMTDANEKCDFVTARHLMNVARDHGVLFVEEPLPWSAENAYTLLKGADSVPIAGGEHAQNHSQLTSMMRNGVLGVVQPDLAMIGGLTPVLNLSVVAEALGVTMSPHFLHGLFAHIGAASQSVRWLEEFPLLEALFEGWPALEEGRIAISASPGHGLSLSEKAIGLLKKT
ncbi:L-alanine-DL-glutamate epimerase [Bradyrhizobium erythrophlei]|nr:L-alanine-DL-glutamate epimerase [Bradyrhizobium erythrophlei]